MQLPSQSGEVLLVGTGPGDPELLTVKAVRALESADVVLYDRLVSDEILALAGGSTVMVYVGKQRGFHTRTQEEIHALLAGFAREGARVVRLKGGDPFVFGRGGEEAAYLRAHGVCVRTVPGVTAAAGCGADLGVPLTHRGLATGVKFLTGHARPGGSLDAAVAEAARDPDTTLVVYMGLSTLPELEERLTQGGLDPRTPAVAIERGTTPAQRAVFAPLDRLQGAVTAAALESPTLLIIGPVVSLAPGWALASDAPDGTALLVGQGSAGSLWGWGSGDAEPTAEEAPAAVGMVPAVGDLDSLHQLGAGHRVIGHA